MHKSVRVTLTIVAAVGLASCGRKRMDPCEAATFNEQACQSAVHDGGYYWQGSWFPMTYSQPYPYYYDHYRARVSQGGPVAGASAGDYSHPAGVERGGFGASGSAHGEAGGHGAGE